MLHLHEIPQAAEKTMFQEIPRRLIFTIPVCCVLHLYAPETKIKILALYFLDFQGNWCFFKAMGLGQLQPEYTEMAILLSMENVGSYLITFSPFTRFWTTYIKMYWDEMQNDFLHNCYKNKVVLQDNISWKGDGHCYWKWGILLYNSRNCTSSCCKKYWTYKQYEPWKYNNMLSLVFGEKATAQKSPHRRPVHFYFPSNWLFTCLS